MSLLKPTIEQEAPDQRSASAKSSLQSLTGAERLTGLGFRCWLSGYQNGAIDCWEHAWNAYAGELGPRAARAAIRDLSCWVRAVRGQAQRSIELRPADCDQFCYDECLAVSMVAAAQHDCPAVKACALALLGSAQCDEVVASATRFADVLRENRLLLRSDPLVAPLTRHSGAQTSASH